MGNGGETGASRRARFAWCFFDWANSAFPAVIVTFVFSAYFARGVAASVNEGTALWSAAVVTSAIAIALLSPLFGAIADRTGRRKPWLAGFSAVCIVATALLWFTKPDPNSVLWALVLFALANAAFEIGAVFYNALLPTIAPPEGIGRLSGWGWGLGYFGGLVCLALALFVFVEADPPPFGLDRGAAEHIRIVAPLVALWFAVFALPLFLFTPDAPPSAIRPARAMREGIVTLIETFRRIGRYRNIVRFLIARLLYVDGMNTMFAFGGIYAAGTFGMDLGEIIRFGIALNITAGIGAVSFAWIDDWIGPRRTILIALGGLVLFGLPLLMIESKTAFWLLALPLGIFMGPAQAASRSLMAHLAPDDMRAEMFGLFALSGKVTAFLGPAAFGVATVAFDSQRAGMTTVIVLLALGFVLLLAVREPPG